MSNGKRVNNVGWIFYDTRKCMIEGETTGRDRKERRRKKI